MITFILNNKTIQTEAQSGMTLLDFVRYEKRLTGTKIGCREGDCGACTVLVGSLSENGKLDYKTITSCISPLGNAHGMHIVTVEGTNLKNSLTQAQQAMKANFATQCGFCTPGFVVALTGFAISEHPKDAEHALRAISGNICRCTGYKSIEKAGMEVCEKLEAEEKEISLDWLIKNKFIPDYFKEIPERLKHLHQQRLPHRSAKIVAGGTDLYVQKADDLVEETVQLLDPNDSLKGIIISEEQCTIGAGTTVTELWNHPELITFFPNLRKHLKLVSSEPIRNMASLGGNFVNASPIGDMTGFFLALNSKITLLDVLGEERILPLNTFYKGYKTLDLKEGEIIKEITFKLPCKDTYFNFEKVSKRMHLDIATVNAAIQISIKEEVISEVHLAMGGVAPIPKYLFKTRDFLIGKPFTVQTIQEANTVLQNEIAPISDVRGSSDYKRLLARQLFFAHFTELFPEKFTLTEMIA